MNPHRGVPARIVRGRPEAAPGWAGHCRPGLTPTPARPGKSRCGARAASGAYVVQLNDKRPGRTGHNRNGCVSTPHREPQDVVWLGAVPRSTRPHVPRPRADQKTRSAEQTLPRISLGPGAQPNTHRDRRGPGQLGGEMLRPSTRPDRPRPMRTDGPGRDGLRAISLHFMHKQTWLSPRFDSDITCACSAVKIRVQIAQNPPSRAPLQTRCKRQSRSHERLQIHA